MKAPASRQQVPARPPAHPQLADQGRLALSPPAGFSLLTHRMKGRQGFACSARLLLQQLSKATPAIPTLHTARPPSRHHNWAAARPRGPVVFTRPIHPSPASPRLCPSSCAAPPIQHRSLNSLFGISTRRSLAFSVSFFCFFLTILGFCQQPLAARLRCRRSLAPPGACLLRPATALQLPCDQRSGPHLAGVPSNPATPHA